MDTPEEKNSVSNDVLEKTRDNLDELLKDDGLDKAKRTELEILSYFLMFLMNDRKKINRMYPFYLEQKGIQERRTLWWNRLQWVVIPIVVAGVMTFAYQVIVFYFQVMPVIESIKQAQITP